MLDVRDVTVAFGGAAGARRRVAARRRRRGRGPARAVGQRQEHAAAGHRRPRRARRRAPCSSTAATSPRCRPTGAASAWCSRTSSCSPTATSPPTWRSGCACSGGRARDARAQRVAELLDLVGLAGFEHATGHRAQRRRGRSGSRWPARWRRRRASLLLDEPLTGLDRELHDRLAGELAESCGRPARRRCSSPTTATRRRRSPTASCGWTTLVGARSSSFDAERDAPAARRRAAQRHAVERRRVGGRRRPDDVHLGARRDGDLVAVSTVGAAPFPGGRPAPRRCSCAAWPSTRRTRATASAVAARRRCGQGLRRRRRRRVGQRPRHRARLLPPPRLRGRRRRASSTPDTGLPHHRIRRLPFRSVSSRDRMPSADAR